MWKKGLSFSALILYMSFIFLPILLISLGAFGQKWFGTLLPEGFTLRWYRELFTQRMYYEALMRSLIVAALVIIINLAVSIPAAYSIVVSENRLLKSLYNFIILLPIAIPPVVLGLGFIEAYNIPGLKLIGSLKGLILAQCIYTLPFTLKPIVANLEMLSWKTMEEAAYSLGANVLYIIRKLLIPNLLPGIIAGSIMTFAMSIGEFQLAVILTSSKSQTYPVVLYQAFYVSTGLACAATSLLVWMSIFSLLGIVYMSKLIKATPEKAYIGMGGG
ncbi:MAG: ABC transporter permease subunit [Synergistetes bacterium]|nr:ABC transporter permease subunit [Synergistota bacterium]MDW8191724.1 ABC transporter permease subunit [Synergistota bacterium]